MTDVALFHHAQGLTAGVREFADELSAAGHRVTVPDLFDGATFDTIEDGLAYTEQVGFETVIASPPSRCPTRSSVPDSRSG